MNEHFQNSEEILNHLIEKGMIDAGDLQNEIDIMQNKRYLEMHPYKIFEGADGYWHTYLLEGDGKRKAVKRKIKKDIETIVVDYWKERCVEEYTFKARFEIWKERQRTYGRSGNTIKKYESEYKRFFEGYPLEEMDIRNITDENIFKHFKQVLEEKQIPYKALKETFGYMSGVFEKAIKDKVLSADKNPCVYIELLMLKKLCKRDEVKTAKERTLSDKERKVLLEKLEHPLNRNVNFIVNCAVELSLYTGMRVGELAALDWNKHIKEDYIIIEDSEKYDRETKQFYISTTKNDKIRFFPITDEIKKILHKIKEYQIEHNCFGDFVFQNEKGKIHARTISDSIRNKTLSKEFNNPKSIHAVRRTLNSNLRCNGVSVTVASSLMGHTERVNQENYTYDVVDLDNKLEIVKKAGAIG